MYCTFDGVSSFYFFATTLKDRPVKYYVVVVVNLSLSTQKCGNQTRFVIYGIGVLVLCVFCKRQV